ncbi:TPA: hypothetical protein ACWLUJ_006141 [Pseudomonas aeruginosa]|nr:hypothetical protein [Pseudomonas aeruginosa]
MAATSRFKLKLGRLKRGANYTALCFRSHISALERELTTADPVITSVVGETMDYGSLFAYLFRRFGYPNAGWDDYKELTKYILSTPNPDMFLQVVPYTGNTTWITFRFFVTEELAQAVRAHDDHERTEWERRAFAWRERQGLPEWMPDWIKMVNEEVYPAWGITNAEVTSWREAIRSALPLGADEDESPYYDLSNKAYQFHLALIEDYRRIEARPPRLMRSADISTWAQTDPLRPLAEAAIIALQDLLRPVRVRDIAINALGATEFNRRVLKEAPVSGYPSGSLGNCAPAEFADLHGLIMRLGKGDARKGVAKAKAALEALSLPSTPA